MTLDKFFTLNDAFATQSPPHSREIDHIPTKDDATFAAHWRFGDVIFAVLVLRVVLTRLCKLFSILNVVWSTSLLSVTSWFIVFFIFRFIFRTDWKFCCSSYWGYTTNSNPIMMELLQVLFPFPRKYHNSCLHYRGNHDVTTVGIPMSACSLHTCLCCQVVWCTLCPQKTLTFLFFE